MGQDLTDQALVVAPQQHAVVLGNAEEASGLADMLHQFLQQTLESPDKVRQARRLRGQLLFCAAEDPAIRVRIAFSPGAIHIADADDSEQKGPRLTADFLSTAHLTTGEASPFALLARRKITARFGPGHIVFLFRFLSLMRIPAEGQDAPTRRWVWPAALTLMAAALVALYFAIIH